MFDSAGASPAAPGMDRPSLRDRLRGALGQPLRPRFEGERTVTSLPDLSSLGGRWFQSPHGPGYVIESVYEAGHEHGSVPLHAALAVDPARLGGQVRDQRLASCSPRDFLFVDTETTGMGGAGAMVFLAGVARFDGAVLRLRQYLLPGPQYEAGLLGGLAEELAGAAALVSYNGKSFDVPMLEARYILSRQQPAFRQLPHLDLLHPNRRLLRGVLPSHRLVQLESEVLGFEREADCPSSEVPQRYFQFQRSSDPTHILPVLRHNAWDVLSLVALAAHLGAVCEGRGRPLQTARAAEYEGDLAAALERYERVIESSAGRAERLEAFERAARCATRLGDYARAAALWEALIAEPRSRRVLPYVELAKLREHRLRDPAAALASVERTIALVRQGLVPPGPPGSELSLQALEHRASRLRTRLTRAGARV